MVEDRSYVVGTKDAPMKIVVYTAIFGGIDQLWSICPTTRGKATYVCFSNVSRKEMGLWSGKRLSTKKPPNSLMWKVRRVKQQWSPRRTARHYKCLPHRYLPDADVWIWVDCNVRLVLPPEKAVGQWLHSDLATFKHPDRNCLYIEAAFCAKRKDDKPTVLKAQVERYRKAGMPTRWGLAETGLVIRRNTSAICELNEAWWSEIKRGSIRDQVSFPFICWKKNIRWTTIPGNCGMMRCEGPFYFIRHKT